MTMVDADWSFDRQTGNLRYIGDDHGGASPSYATVIEMHRWVQGKLDDAEYVGDDELDIININASSRQTDNIITLVGGANIDDVAAEHLYDGSVIQNDGDDIYDGIVNYGNSDVQIQIIQNGVVLTDDWWNFGGGGLNADANNGISHRFMIKVRSAGSDIDNKRLIGICRRFNYTYGEFIINATANGNNVLALSDATDLNNQTAAATVATWDQFANNSEGFFQQDVDGLGSAEDYYSNWNIGGGTTPASPTINDLFEWTKYVSRDGSASTLYGLSGELFRGITHELDGTQSAGTFVEPEEVSWTGGTGQLLAIDSTTAGTKMWIQVLTGSAPSTGNVSGATGVFGVTGNTSRPISTPFIGVSTGSAIIGSYGLNVDSGVLTANDKLFDLTNTQITPPNNVQFSVAGLVVGEDRVLVGPWDGVTTDIDGNPEIDYNQNTHSTLLNGVSVTSITVDTAIPTDTPATGTIRVECDNGKYKLCEYTSYTGSTFTITAEDFSTDTSDGTTTAKNVFISYLDKLAASATESFTSVYLADRDLVVKVRDGGASPIKEYITGSSLTGNGGSVTAIRTVDS